MTKEKISIQELNGIKDFVRKTTEQKTKQQTAKEFLKFCKNNSLKHKYQSEVLFVALPLIEKELKKYGVEK